MWTLGSWKILEQVAFALFAVSYYGALSLREVGGAVMRAIERPHFHASRPQLIETRAIDSNSIYIKLHPPLTTSHHLSFYLNSCNSHIPSSIRLQLPSALSLPESLLSFTLQPSDCHQRMHARSPLTSSRL